MTDQKLRTSAALSGWRLGGAAVVLCAMMSSAGASDQSSGEENVAASDPCLTDNLCKAHYDEARKAYKEKRYDEAYKEYKAAYERRQAPWLLINVGRSLQRLGRNKESLDFYQRYLKADPNPKPETVTKVNEYIEQVKAGIVDEPEPKPEASPSSQPSPQPQVAAAQVPASGTSAVEPEKTPIYKKWWLWTIVGVVVAGGVAGGVVGGLLANRETIQMVQSNPPVPTGVTVYMPSF